jgi:hypothetical protein
MAGKFDAIKPRSPVNEPDPTAFIEAGLQRSEPAVVVESVQQRQAPKKRIKKQKMIIMSDETDQCLEQMIVDLMRSHPEQHRQLNRSSLIAAAIHSFAQLSQEQQIRTLQDVE